jgi:hypothetical protein
MKNRTTSYSKKTVALLSTALALLVSGVASTDYTMTDFHTKWFWTRPSESKVQILVALINNNNTYRFL